MNFCYKICTILKVDSNLLISIKKIVTFTLLLCLFGQVMASGMNYCKMEKKDLAKNCPTCEPNTDTISDLGYSYQSQPTEQDEVNELVECTQDCECCLDPYSFGTPMPLKFLSSIQLSLKKAIYNNPSIISLTESLYRPPISC